MADVAEEYRSSLAELNFNSKPHINMLTMLAEENLQHAPIIVQTIVDHIKSVTPDVKLPSLYLVDSIVKNIGQIYSTLFSKHLVDLFTSVFEKVDEQIRSLLFKLRSTWTGIFPSSVLLELDKSVTCLDPAWPVPQLSHKNIHVNPKFLDKPVVENKETLSKSQCALLEVEMKKKQLELLKSLEEKKKKLLELQIQAGVESSKIDIQKKVNTRDPRIAKKVAAASLTDSSTLQSVIVVPKGNTKKRNEKNLPSSVSKKVKLEDEHHSKIDITESLEHESNSNHSSEIQNDIKLRIQPLKHEVINHSDPNKNEQILKYPIELRSRSDGILQKQISLTLNLSNKCVIEIPSSRSDSVFKDREEPEEKKYHYSQPVSSTNKEIFDKNLHKLEPPPLPPLFLGGEDKDYRFLLNREEKNLNEESCHKRMYSQNNTWNRNNLPSKRNLHAFIDIKPINRVCSENYSYLYTKSHNFSYGSKLDYPCDHFKIRCQANFPKGLSVPVVKSFKLDNMERKVYFVKERSFAFLDDNIPRELTFEGVPQLVFIEGLPHPIELRFGDHEVKFEIDGKYHFIKFGTPSREVYLDDIPYEASFGGPPFTAVLNNGKVCWVKISGPAPKVLLSSTPAYDLYEKFCKNNQEFLQRFDNGIPDKIVDSRQDIDMRVTKKVLSSSFFDFPLEKMSDVNWQRIHVGNSQQTEWTKPKNSFETCKEINHNFSTLRNYSEESDWKRPSSLPEVSNSVLVPPPLPPKQLINRLPGIPSSNPFEPTFNNVNPSSQHLRSEYPISLPSSNEPFIQPKNSDIFSKDSKSNETLVIPKLAPPPLPPFLNTIPSTGCLTSLSMNNEMIQTSVSLCNSTITATFPRNQSPLTLPMTQTVATVASLIGISLPMTVTSTSSCLIPNTAISSQMLTSTVAAPVPIVTASVPATSATSTLLNKGPVNMNLILKELVAAGVIGKTSGSSTSVTTSTSDTTTTVTATSVTSSEREIESTDKKNETLVKEDPVPEIVFEPKCLRKYYPGVINALHRGTECATCGMRFKEIQSEQYRSHLDWHFRRNHREKDRAKKPFSRRLFYEIKDWIQFKEFEDVDERAPSYFELQANDEQAGEASPEVICSVACSQCESEKCAVCEEQFQLFWVEEEEEWHLKNAVQHNDQVYHPACYEDFEKANNPADPDSSFEESKLDVKTEVEQENSVQIKEEKEEDVDMETKHVDSGKVEKEDNNQSMEDNVTEKEENKLEKENNELKTENNKLEKENNKLEKENNKLEKENNKLEKENNKLERNLNEAKDLKMKDTVEVAVEVTQNDVVMKDAQKEIPVQSIDDETKVETAEDKIVMKNEGKHGQEEMLKTEGKATDVEMIETETVIKTEPMDCDDEEDRLVIDLNSETQKMDSKDTDSKNEDVDLAVQIQPADEPLSTPCKDEAKLTSHENVPTKSEEEEEDIEFRPPTPDPRFEVLPPVFKGTEISNLCTIM